MRKTLARKPDGTFDGVPCSPAQRRLLESYVEQGLITAALLEGVSKKAASLIIREHRQGRKDTLDGVGLLS